MLSHGRVKIVLNHHHDGSSLTRPGGICVNRTGIHIVSGTETIHIYTSVGVKLLYKFRSKLGMQSSGEIAERIAQSQPLLLGSEYVFTARGMAHRLVTFTTRGQDVGYTLYNLILEIGCL